MSLRSRWEKRTDEWGRDYYVDHLEKATVWQAPRGVVFGADGFEVVAPTVDKNESLPPAYDIAVNASTLPVNPPGYVDPSNPPFGSNQSTAAAPYSPYTDVVYQPPASQYQPPTLGAYSAPATTSHYAIPMSQGAIPNSDMPATYGATGTSTYGANAGTRGPLPHAPVVPIDGPSPQPPKQGFFNTIARSFQQLVHGTPNHGRIYPQAVQMSPIAKVEETRESYAASLLQQGACETVGSTLCELKAVTAFTLAIALWLFLLIFSATKVKHEEAWLGLMIPSIVFFAYAFIAYNVVIVCCSFCVIDTGRMACGCLTPLYLPFHQAVKRTDTTVGSLYTHVNALDDSRPGLYIRLEGYVNESDYNFVNHSHGTYLQQRRGTPETMYGFTHHFPVVVAAAANTSASAVELDRWFQQHSDYSAVSFKYTYTLSPQDRQWVDYAMAELKRIYTGHEGCRYIRTSLVYTLDSVTPVGTMPLSPINTNGCYDRLRRPGVNSALHDWMQVAEDDKPGVVAGSLQIVKHNDTCCRDLFFNNFCALLSLMTVLYLPYIFFYRCCIVREFQFVHKKALRLQHELAPITYDRV